VRTIGLSARLTRLVTDDVIVQDAREWVLERLTYDRGQREARREHALLVASADSRGAGVKPLKLPPPASRTSARIRLKLAKLITCRWCTGVWVAASVVVLDRQLGGRSWWRAIGDAATAAYLVGWLAGREQD
jgi:hypothetical protein